jgi:hypothetical protein
MDVSVQDLQELLEGRVGTFQVIQSRTRVMGWHFARYSVQNSGYGLAFFTSLCSQNTNR